MVLVLALVAVVAACAFHLVTRRPITQVLPLPPVVGGGPRAPQFVMNIEGLKRPAGVWADGERNQVYVADSEAGLVRVFDRDGNALFSLPREETGKLRGPISVASSNDGTIFVVDRLDNIVLIFSDSGEILGHFWPANMPTTFKMAPLSVAFDRADNMYLGDGDGAAYVFDSERNLKQRLIAPEGTIRGPFGIDATSSGLIAVAETTNGRVLVFNSDGTLERIVGQGDLSLPSGVAIDEDGNVFVADTSAHRVFVYDNEGRLAHTFGEHGALDGQMSFPQDIALDGEGKIYVADRANHRIQVWSY